MPWAWHATQCMKANCIRRLCADFNQNRLREALLYNPSHDSAWKLRWRANNKIGPNRVSLKGMSVWGVNSTLTKHSDHFVWKNMSERMARRCDDTIDKNRVNSCVIKHLFSGSRATKKITTTPRNCFLQRCTNVTFSGAAKVSKGAHVETYANRSNCKLGIET